jgi:hypothetical protein
VDTVDEQLERLTVLLADREEVVVQIEPAASLLLKSLT